MNITPKFAFYRNSESVQFFTDVVELCHKNNSEALNLATPLDKLEQNNTILNASFKKNQKSDLTELLTSYDQRRDDALVGLRKVADGYTHHFDAQKRVAGEDVLQAIDKYGSSIHRFNYQAQTSTTDSLFKDLMAEKLAVAVESIGMTEVVNEMNAANALFSDTFLRRVQETAANDQVATGQLVQEVIQNFRTLVAHIEANNVINPSEAYVSLLKQISELTAKYDNLVTARTVKKETTEELN